MLFILIQGTWCLVQFSQHTEGWITVLGLFWATDLWNLKLLGLDLLSCYHFFLCVCSKCTLCMLRVLGMGVLFLCFLFMWMWKGMRAGQEDGVKIGGCLLFRVCPCWLIFSWWGRYSLSLRHKPTKLSHSFYSVLVFVSVFMALSTVFHSMKSPDRSLLSYSVLPVFFLPYWSFHLYIFW